MDDIFPQKFTIIQYSVQLANHKQLYNCIEMSEFPHPNPMKSYWIEEGPSILKNHRTTPELPQIADVVIIGSGYSGTSVASNLLLDKFSKFNGNIVMLEARDVCSGATGRNGGHIRSFYHGVHKHFVDKYGKETAANISMFEHNEMDKVKQLVDEFEIDCDFDLRRSCQTFMDPRTYKTGLDNFYAFQNNEFIPQDIRNQVKIHFDPEFKEEISEHKVGPFCITAPTCSVWPYKLITSLLLRCIKTGCLNLQTFTTVRNLKPSNNNEGWIVKTSRGVIKCKKVVVATNAWTRTLLPEFKDKIIPVKGCVSHIKPISKNPGKLNFNYFHTFPYEGDYVTAHKDMSLIVGGGGKTYLKFPNSIEMFNNSNDSYAPKESLDYFKNYPNEKYPNFAKDLTFENDYTWTGCMAYTNDEFPFVGDMSPFGRKNLFVIAGFSGHGMPRIWSCGEYIAGLIDGTGKCNIPSVFLNTVDRMYSTKHGLFDDLADYDINNRNKFKL